MSQLENKPNLSLNDVITTHCSYIVFLNRPECTSYMAECNASENIRAQFYGLCRDRADKFRYNFAVIAMAFLLHMDIKEDSNGYCLLDNNWIRILLVRYSVLLLLLEDKQGLWQQYVIIFKLSKWFLILSLSLGKPVIIISSLP